MNTLDDISSTSSNYKETAAYIVNAIKELVDAIENAIHEHDDPKTQLIGWSAFPVAPNGDRIFSRDSANGRRHEVMHYSETGETTFIASYSCTNIDDGGVEAIGEVGVRHDGGIETRSFARRPEQSREFAWPFKLVADNPDDLTEMQYLVNGATISRTATR